MTRKEIEDMILRERCMLEGIDCELAELTDEHERVRREKGELDGGVMMVFWKIVEVGNERFRIVQRIRMLEEWIEKVVE